MSVRNLLCGLGLCLALNAAFASGGASRGDAVVFDRDFRAAFCTLAPTLFSRAYLHTFPMQSGVALSRSAGIFRNTCLTNEKEVKK